MRFAAALIAATLFSTSALAQANAPGAQNQAQPNFDQFPSFIQMNASIQDGTQVVLRCGYSQNGMVISADPGYMEMSMLNEGTGSYLRYQRIDNKFIITVPAQNAPGRFMIEVVDPNGTTSAKNCVVDGVNDTIQGCTPIQPFMPAQQVSSQDTNAANQCGTFFSKATQQLDRYTYNSLKTDSFKNGLRQKVAVLEAR